MAATEQDEILDAIKQMSWQRFTDDNKELWPRILNGIQKYMDTKKYSEAQEAIDECLYHIQSTWSIRRFVAYPDSIKTIPRFSRPWIIALFGKLVILIYYIEVFDDQKNKITNYTPFLDRLWLLNDNYMPVIGLNWQWYLPKLLAEPLLPNKKLDNLSIPKLTTKDGYYNACQASMITIPNKGYIICQRLVNYTQKGATHFESMDTDGIVRTENMLCWLDFDLQIIKQRPIVNAYEGAIYNARVKGWEDLRLFITDRTDCYLGATLSTWETKGNSVFIALIYLPLTKDEIYDFSPSSVETPINVKKLVPLESPLNAYCEKNWLPLNVGISGHSDKWIYNYNPLTVVKIDHDTGVVNIDEQKTSKLNTSSWRGSGPPIPYNNGYLLSIHETSRLKDKINYFTRLVHISKDYELKSMSTLFYFDHVGVEFSLSMAWDIGSENLLILAGLEDAALQIYSLSLKTLDALLSPIENYWHWTGKPGSHAE